MEIEKILERVIKTSKYKVAFVSEGL